MDMKKTTRRNRITVIGPSVVDVLAVPVNFCDLHAGSQLMEEIIMSCGGDALNEAVILKRLGVDVELISKVGTDQAGNRIMEFLMAEGVSCKGITRDDTVRTSINIVLVDGKGERYFLTKPGSSLRKLAEQDIMANLDTEPDIVSFASMFVSPLLDIASMARIFRSVKKRPDRILAVDMTKAKNGERLRDLEPILKYIDFIFPNESEISMLTGKKDAYENARLLVESGVKCAVIKRGGNGCLIYANDEFVDVPAYPVRKAVDSTGAGDSFVAGFLYGLHSGFTVKECGAFANAVASCVVECLGATHGIGCIEKPYARYKEMMERGQV